MSQSVDQYNDRFATLLEKNAAYTPMAHRLAPLWTPVPSPELRGVIAAAHIPTVNWGPSDVEAAVPEGTPLVEIDANGAFVAAASSGTFAHCELARTGPIELPASGQIPAGYLLMDAHPWLHGAPGSPLGPGRPKLTQEGRVWLPHTVASALRDLTYGAKWGAKEGTWGGCAVYDSWTADVCRLTKWAEAVRDTRAAAKIVGDTNASERIKTAYSQAVQMWATPPDPKGTPADKRKKKNKAYRPDWYAALRGQHAMNMWRRAYTCTQLGAPPLRIMGTDRMVFAEQPFLTLLRRDAPPRPIQLDETGLGLGTFTRERRWYAGIEL